MCSSLKPHFLFFFFLFYIFEEMWKGDQSDLGTFVVQFDLHGWTNDHADVKCSLPHEQYRTACFEFQVLICVIHVLNCWRLNVWCACLVCLFRSDYVLENASSALMCRENLVRASSSLWLFVLPRVTRECQFWILRVKFTSLIVMVRRFPVSEIKVKRSLMVDIWRKQYCHVAVVCW